LPALAAAFVGATVAPSGAANLVQNPGFEQAMSNWTSYGGWISVVGDGGLSPAAGNYFAATACVYFCDMSQNVGAIAGHTYTLSFDYNPGYGATIENGELRVYWNSNLVADIYRGNLGWSTYTINDLTTTTYGTALLFSAWPGYWAGIDNVSVTLNDPQVPAVPEPSTWAMLLVGFAGVGFMAYRRTNGKSWAAIRQWPPSPASRESVQQSADALGRIRQNTAHACRHFDFP
jgi:PEP-CTERM motif